MRIVPLDLSRCLPFTRESATRLAKTADQFVSAITLERDGMTLNLKSTLGLLSQTLPTDGHVTLVCDGVDEAAAVDALVAFAAGRG